MHCKEEKREAEVKLVPFEVNQVMNNTSEIPDSVRLLEAPKIWEQDEKGQGVVVAVLDTGVDTTHLDLKSNIIDGRNFTSDYNSDKNNYYDNNGHGTHVAGSIAGTFDNKGIVGVAPEAKLLICKVLTGNGGGQYDWIINAIHYALDWRGKNGERVRVINMSLGGPHDVPELHEAIQRAILEGVAVVVAAGNEGDNSEDTFETAYPGAYNEVIQVGAINHEKKMAEFTNTNSELDVVAQGVDVLSTYPSGKYATLSGTSMATPHVSGALALLINLGERAFKRELTEAEIYALLVKNTIPLGYQASTEGHGLVKLTIMDKLKSLIRYIEEDF